MLDLAILSDKDAMLAALRAGLTRDDLRHLTIAMIDTQQALIAAATDADVIFQPSDPSAHDSYAATAAEEGIAWTLGHVIVHTTATSEEAAFLAAEQARGVLREGRSRYETHWEEVTTILECRARLEESRRIRLATLDVWPTKPHLDVVIERRWFPDPVDAFTRFVLGLSHDADHLGQIEDIISQAAAAR